MDNGWNQEPNKPFLGISQQENQAFMPSIDDIESPKRAMDSIHKLTERQDNFISVEKLKRASMSARMLGSFSEIKAPKPNGLTIIPPSKKLIGGADDGLGPDDCHESEYFSSNYQHKMSLSKKDSMQSGSKQILKFQKSNNGDEENEMEKMLNEKKSRFSNSIVKNDKEGGLGDSNQIGNVEQGDQNVVMDEDGQLLNFRSAQNSLNVSSVQSGHRKLSLPFNIDQI